MIRRLVPAVISLAFLASSISCGPIQYISQVSIRAEKAVAAAKLQKADIYAKYEYYGARAYLEQAKHRAGFGDFQTAYHYGLKSEKLANKAVKLAKRRREEERDVGDTPAGRAVAPPRR